MELNKALSSVFLIRIFIVEPMDTIMNLRARLTGRIRKSDVEIIRLSCKEEAVYEELYRLIFEPDMRVAWNAMWILTGCTPSELEHLSGRCDELTDHLLHCSHSGCRRLLLTLMNRLSGRLEFRSDLFDYCLTLMQNPNEPYGVRAMCMKLSFSMCRPYPELCSELRSVVEMMEQEYLPASLKCVCRRIWPELSGKEKQKGSR